MEYILDNFKEEKDMVKVNLYGLTENNLMEIGLKERKMDLAFGNHQKVIIMKVNGNKIDRVEKVITFMLEDQNIEVNLNNFSNMEKDSRNFLMEIATLDNIHAESLTDMENMSGQMGIYIRDSFFKVRGKEKV